LHPPSAFPLAQLAVELGTSVVEIPAVLITLLFRKCCFAIPRYPNKTGTDEQFKKDCGYNQLNGKISETDSAFAERMSGLISLFAALVQTSSFSGKRL
jgi:nucleoporin GLE1